MKKNIKILVMILPLLLIITIYSKVQAATVTLNVPDEVTVGEPIKVSVNINAAQWDLTIGSDGKTLASSNELVNAEKNLNKSFETTVNTTKEGKIVITLTGDYTDIDNTNKEISVSKEVTVKAKAVEEPKNTEAENPQVETPKTEVPQTENPKAETPQVETPKKEEPNFSNSNKTMYTTKDDVLLRDNWDVKSGNTVKKGTELKIIATSTNKVNGYVWYKVSYEGKTKYIASSLLTETKPEEEKKSDNTNLKSLTVEKQTLIPQFSPQVISYTVQVSNDVEKIQIKAEPEDEKATVSIKGTENLKEGQNTVTISVSAEDGTNKIYEINVEKLKKEEPKTAILGLKVLKIENTDIEKEFKPNIYNYNINIKEKVEKLKIEASASDEKSTVEILGNENLQDGENIITIIVSSPNNEEKVTYQIKANVGQKEATLINTPMTTEKGQINPKIYIYGIAGLFLILALIIVIIYVIKHKGQEEYDNDEFETFPEELNERKTEEKWNSSEYTKENTMEVNYDKQNMEDDTLKNKDKVKSRKGKHF